MRFIDAHAHLHDRQFDEDRGAVIARFFDDGGEAIINVGTSVQESHDAVRVAQDYDRVYATVGLHPHVFNGGKERDNEWMQNIGAEHKESVRMDAFKDATEALEGLLSDAYVVAVGEIGLDYFLPGDDCVTAQQKKWQRTGFVVQIALAKKYTLPVVVHCRPQDVAQSDAYFDCVQIISDASDTQFVLHCYMGNVSVTEDFLALENVSFSFTGNVTYSKNDDDQMSQVITKIPLERMMIETDAPYLTPVPLRGSRNEPFYVQHVAQRIAALKEVDVDTVYSQTIENTKDFFRLT